MCTFVRTQWKWSSVKMAMDTMAVELPDLSTHTPRPPAEETAEEKWVLSVLPVVLCLILLLPGRVADVDSNLIPPESEVVSQVAQDILECCWGSQECLALVWHTSVPSSSSFSFILLRACTEVGWWEYKEGRTFLPMTDTTSRLRYTADLCRVNIRVRASII